MMHGADQVRRKDEAAFQNRNHQQVLGLSRRDFAGKHFDAFCNVRFREQDRNAVAVDGNVAHGEGFEPISSLCAKRICRFFAVSGGEATRVTKLVDSPARKGLAPVSRVQV